MKPKEIFGIRPSIAIAFFVVVAFNLACLLITPQMTSGPPDQPCSPRLAKITSIYFLSKSDFVLYILRILVYNSYITLYHSCGVIESRRICAKTNNTRERVMLSEAEASALSE